MNVDLKKPRNLPGRRQPVAGVQSAVGQRPSHTACPDRSASPRPLVALGGTLDTRSCGGHFVLTAELPLDPPETLGDTNRIHKSAGV